MPAWVRVHLPGVGTWSQRDDVPTRPGAQVLDGVEALDPAGRPLPDVPEAALDGADDDAFGDWFEQSASEPDAQDAPSPAAPAGATAEKAATTPGDTKAGTPTPTGTTSPNKE